MPSLVTAARASLLLGTASSPRLEALLEVASAQLEAAVGFPLAYRAEASVPCHSPGGAYLWCYQGLIRSITSVELDGSDFDASTYVLEDAVAGRVRRVGGVWPQTALHGGSPDSTALQSVGRIRLTGAFGFVTPEQATPELPADVPGDVELAVAMLAQRAIVGTMGVGIASQSLGGASVTFDRSTLATWPSEAFAAVARLRGSRGVIAL